MVSTSEWASLKRYWLTFERLGRPHPVNLGCGVTARDYDDALSLVQAAFPELIFGAPLAVVEDVDVSALDEKHIAPNLGNVLVRGISWPRIE